MRYLTVLGPPNGPFSNHEAIYTVDILSVYDGYNDTIIIATHPHLMPVLANS